MNPDNFVFFQNIIQLINTHTVQFVDAGFLRVVLFVQTFSEVLVTLWVTWQGYNIVTGRSRESLSVFVLNAGKIFVILLIAHGATIGNDTIRGWVEGFSTSFVTMLLGSQDASIYAHMDKALWSMQNIVNGFNAGTLAGELNGAAIMSLVGQAAPVVLAAALLVINKIILSVLVVFAPLFVLMLIFDVTKVFFWSWLKSVLANIFALAVLLMVSALVLQVVGMYAQTVVSAQTMVEQGETGPSMLNTAALQGLLGVLLSIVLLGVVGFAARLFHAHIAPTLTAQSGLLSSSYSPHVYAQLASNNASTLNAQVVGSSSSSPSLLTQQHIRLTTQGASQQQTRTLSPSLGAGARGHSVRKKQRKHEVLLRNGRPVFDPKKSNDVIDSMLSTTRFEYSDASA